MKTYNTEPKYYVYAYLRERSTKIAEKGTYRYIGKGQGKRFKGSHGNILVPKKMKFIKFIITGIDEEASFILETAMISQYGRIDTKTGILENRSNGGNQPPSALGLKRKPRIFSAESRKKMSNSAKRRIANMSTEQMKERTDKIVASRKANSTEWFSEADKQKMSDTRKILYQLPEYKDIPAKAGRGNKGKPKSLAHIEAIKAVWRQKTAI